MNISIVGSGNVATTLVRGLAKLDDVRVGQIIGRNRLAVERLSSLAQASPCMDLSKMDHQFELCLIAVSDDAITEIVKNLPTDSEKIYAHTSGSIPRTVLDKYENNGVFYPLQTLSSNHEIAWSEIPVFITGSDRTTESTLSALASKLGANSEKITDDQRQDLHLSAIFANNFTNALYGIAHDLVKASKMDFSLLRPLILETARKVQVMYPKDAQTGPAKRDDLKIIDEHLTLLRKHEDWQELYTRMSQVIQQQKDTE